jgi:hypothetical protein
MNSNNGNLSWLSLQEWNDTQIPGSEMPQAISDFKKLTPESTRSNYRRDPTISDTSNQYIQLTAEGLIPRPTVIVDRNNPSIDASNESVGFIQFQDGLLIPRPSILLEPVKVDPDPFNVILFRRAMSVNHRFAFATPPENSTRNPSWAKCHPQYAIW